MFQSTAHACSVIYVQLIAAMQNCLVGAACKVSRRHIKLYVFAKQLMGVAHHLYACTQTCQVKVCFIAKVGS